MSELLTPQLYSQFQEELAGGFGNLIINFNGRTATDMDQLELIAKAEGLDLSKIQADAKTAPAKTQGQSDSEPDLTPQQRAAATKAAKKAAAEAEGEAKKVDPAGDPGKIQADAKTEAEEVIKEGTDALETETDPVKIEEIQSKIDAAKNALSELG